MSKDIKQIADFVLIKAGEIYIINKDRFGFFAFFMALDQHTLDSLFGNPKFKVLVIDGSGKTIKKNFIDSEQTSVVKSLLEEVTMTYEQKLQAIDNALVKGDKETFMRLTTELYGGVADGVH